MTPDKISELADRVLNAEREQYNAEMLLGKAYGVAKLLADQLAAEVKRREEAEAARAEDRDKYEVWRKEHMAQLAALQKQVESGKECCALLRADGKVDLSVLGPEEDRMWLYLWSSQRFPPVFSTAWINEMKACGYRAVRARLVIDEG